MNYILILLLPIVLSADVCNDMPALRSAFHAIEHKEDLSAFLLAYEEKTCCQAEPYIASAIMNQAEYAFFPTKKMKYFNTGKDRLEAYIKSHPDCIEGKYVRFLIQREIPGFLNYDEHIETDSLFIVEHIATSNLPLDYQNIIIQNISKQS